VILPTYNESENIIELINQIIKNIDGDFRKEIIIVDDNSPDKTYNKVKEHFNNNPDVRALLRTEDRGLAKSLLAGIRQAKGDQVVIMDTDFTHDPIEISNLLYISKVYDIVSCSRFCVGGNMDDKTHYILSLLFNWFLRLILRTQIQDNLGGYFTIKKEKLDSLPLDKIFYGYGDYYFRLLHYAQKNGYSIIEIPGKYRTRTKGSSKSNFLRLLFLYTSEVLKLRIKNSN